MISPSIPSSLQNSRSELSKELNGTSHLQAGNGGYLNGSLAKALNSSSQESVNQGFNQLSGFGGSSETNNLNQSGTDQNWKRSKATDLEETLKILKDSKSKIDTLKLRVPTASLQGAGRTPIPASPAEDVFKQHQDQREVRAEEPQSITGTFLSSIASLVPNRTHISNRAQLPTEYDGLRTRVSTKGEESAYDRYRQEQTASQSGK